MSDTPCLCGCGLYPTRDGSVCLRGHFARTIPTEFRFWKHVGPVDENGCWPWVGTTLHNGYGQFFHNSKKIRAHRYSYELYVGLIGESLTLDHLCRNRACVNPSHLEPTTRKENVLRGNGATAINAKKTHCPTGHEYHQENTRTDALGKRSCRECGKIRGYRRRGTRMFASTLSIEGGK